MNLNQTIDLLKAASEPVRYRLLALCARHQMAVNELVEVLGQSQPSVSRHLRILSDAGLLERQRSGKQIFYAVAQNSEAARNVRLLLSLINSDDELLQKDLNASVAFALPTESPEVDYSRLFNRAILDVAATGAIGSVLDIGMGSARIMTLLASSATRLVGVDKDRAVRVAARAALKDAGLSNCSVLQGDMYQLPFDHEEFNTVIMDEILFHSDEPVFALTEAARALVNGGRIIILEKFTAASDKKKIESQLATWLKQTHLRGGSFRHIQGQSNHWLIGVATKSS